MLDGAAEPEGVAAGTAEMLREAWRMASVLRQRRFEGGALDLEMPEIRVRLDDEGRAVGVEPVGHGPSHQLIEECMLAANEAVARLLEGAAEAGDLPGPRGTGPGEAVRVRRDGARRTATSRAI